MLHLSLIWKHTNEINFQCDVIRSLKDIHFEVSSFHGMGKVDSFDDLWTKGSSILFKYIKGL